VRPILPRIYWSTLNRLRILLGKPPTSRAYFEYLYSRDDDPWLYRTARYEIEKYEKTLNTIRGLQPKRVLELGCSIGVFTQMLAPNVEFLLGCDISTQAISRARVSCAEFTNVRFMESAILDIQCELNFDVIVAAEVLYYVSRDEVEISHAVAVLNQLLLPGGYIVVVCGGHEYDAKNNWEDYFVRFSNGEIVIVFTELAFADGRPYRLSLMHKKVNS
jgi:2-polyprenyl-3-methyl-5-hydroxy-6-metoxy-1,4-benzoquinol methylase